jgi:hypothetical protein
MGDKKALVPYISETPQPIVDPLRQKIESRLRQFNDMDAALLLRTLKKNTNQDGIGWKKIAENLEYLENQDFISALYAFSLAAGTVASLGASLYTSVNIGQNIDNDGSNETSGGFLVPSIAANVGHLFMLLPTLVICDRLPICKKTSDFKNFLKNLDDEENLLESVDNLMNESDCSVAEKQAINNAKSLALLSDGSLHNNAFKLFLEKPYSYSPRLYFVLATVIFALDLAASSGMQPAYLNIPFTGLYALSMLASVSVVIARGKHGKEKNIFHKVINDIRSAKPDLFKEAEVVQDV